MIFFIKRGIIDVKGRFYENGNFWKIWYNYRTIGNWWKIQDQYVMFTIHGKSQTGTISKQLKNSAVVEIDETAENANLMTQSKGVVIVNYKELKKIWIWPSLHFWDGFFICKRKLWKSCSASNVKNDQKRMWQKLCHTLFRIYLFCTKQTVTRIP